MIRLLDLLGLTGVSLGKFKIHCAVAVPGDDDTPLGAFYDGKFKTWQECQGNRNFQCDHILSLIQLGGSEWLFAGIYKVKGVRPRSNRNGSWFEYSTSEIPGLEHLTGKVIIEFDKKFRASYLRGEKYDDFLLVKEIKPERQSIGDFPGYHNVRMSLRDIKTIVRQPPQSWKTALSNVSGIYLIADTTTGKQYVGSAYGGGGMWQRWSAYAHTGHGGNKELRQLLSEKGDDYAGNFSFTILEVIDLNASKEDITAREDHWKEALLTRIFGYNKN